MKIKFKIKGEMIMTIFPGTLEKLFKTEIDQ
jgi:hypothetical protein